MVRSVDVLFIDEAGQMSLADAIAAASCATNLVLLGDPQQLDQPLQGTHPPGAECSALAHLLNGEQVMPDHLGLFLDGTWRLHPRICAYTSEVFYSGRLHAHPGRDSLALAGEQPFDGAGIRFLSVSHEGHSSDSPEEAAAIAVAVRQPARSEADVDRCRRNKMSAYPGRHLDHHAVQCPSRSPDRNSPGFPHRDG